ncbi:MAG: TonB-dependent receptor [Chitinophagaceae bacterium]|nr:TonB-dependent receptor [Chitinophagaceae bacterium]
MTKKSWVFVAATVISSPIFAQDSSRVLDPIVVTANKLEQKQSTTGKVITVIGREEIERSSGKTLTQLLNEQAGITVNGALNNMGAVQTVYARGASSGRTLILLDGIPMNDPSMINNEFDLNLFALDNIESIEICKGAQSTLYGSDAVAGVINILTVKKDVSRPFNVKSVISAGNYGILKGNLQLYGKAKNLSYTAKYAKIRSGGFSSARDTTGSGRFDKDNYNGEIMNAQVKYQLTPQLSIRAFGLYSEYQAGIDASVFKDEKDYNIDNYTATAGAGFDYKKGRLSITGNYQYSDVKRTYLNDSLQKTSTIFEDNRYKGTTQFVELYGNLQLGNHLTILAGLDYREWWYTQTYYSLSIFSPDPYNPKPIEKDPLDQKSIYGSLIYKGFHEKLNIELGGRINDHSRYGGNSTFTFNPSYSITGNIRVFGSISTGYKAPSIFQLSNNEALREEISKNYEAGIALNNKIFKTRAVYFYRDIDNGIDYNYIDFSYFNYIKQKVHGLELELTADICKQLSISANYTYLSPKEATQNRATNKDTISYSYLLRRPDHNLNLSVTVQPVSSLHVSIGGKYVSNRYDFGGYEKPDIALGDYFLMNAYAEFRHSSQLKFFANFQNITDRTFTEVNGYNSIPFMASGGIALNF